MEQQSRLAEQRSNKPPDFAAFISHAKTDQKKVQEIVGALEQRGFKCWVAPRDVRPGHSYGDEIIRGIERSRCFILALSKASNELPFVAREVERAISKRKPIFPIRIEDVEPSSSLELFISSTQWIDAFSDGDKQIDRLATLLAGEEGTEARSNSRHACTCLAGAVRRLGMACGLCRRSPVGRPDRCISLELLWEEIGEHATASVGSANSRAWICCGDASGSAVIGIRRAKARANSPTVIRYNYAAGSAVIGGATARKSRASDG